MWDLICDNLIWFWESFVAFLSGPVLKVAKKAVKAFREELIDEIVKELSTLVVIVEKNDGDDDAVLGVG